MYVFLTSEAKRISEYVELKKKTDFGWTMVWRKETGILNWFIGKDGLFTGISFCFNHDYG